jgi:hypothetical protein
LPTTARVLIEIAAALITLGGLYDVFASKLPPNLAAICAGNEQACRLVRLLLRALGGALVSIGIAVGLLAGASGSLLSRQTLVLILILVLPSEGVNSICMYRAGSPFYIPMSFACLTLLGVVLGWLS